MRGDGARPRPPLNALKAFEAAARLKSFARAAEELSVTPGAISQQVHILEQHARGRLFTREPRGVSLTPLGAELAPVLREAFLHLDRAADVIYRPQRRPSLAVTAPPSFAAKWLGPRLRRFSEQHPGIEVWMSADVELADVAGGRVDVAVRYGRGPYPGVRAERLLDGAVMPVCAPALARSLKRPSELARQTLIHTTPGAREEARPDWIAWLVSRRVTGVDAEAGPRFDQAALAIDAAIQGRGVALAPLGFVRADLTEGRLAAPFPDGVLETELAYFVLTRKAGASEAARAFARWLTAEAGRVEDAAGEL